MVKYSKFHPHRDLEPLLKLGYNEDEAETLIMMDEAAKHFIMKKEKVNG